MNTKDTTVVSEQLKSDIRNTYDAFLDQVGGQARRGQMQMLGWITKTLMHTSTPNPKVVIEAGTGTGKTLGYLIPGLMCARALGKQVVVATATVSLQRQLLDKDIPLLADSTGQAIEAKLAKGRRRYLCPIRIEHTRFEAGQKDEQLIRALSDPQRTMVEGMYTHFHSGDWNGDLDDWDDSIDRDLIPMITSDHGNCRGRRCEAIEECPFYNARDEIDDAEIIITNHDLVLSDLALGGGVVLPAPGEAIYIFDEAHQLADKAISHQTQNLQLGAFNDWLNSLAKRIKETSKLGLEGGGKAALGRLDRQITPITQPIANLHDAMSSWLGQQMGDSKRWSQSASGLHLYRLAPGQLPSEMAQLASQAVEPFKLCIADLDTLIEALKADAENANGELDTEVARNLQAYMNESKIRMERALALIKSWSRTQTQGPEARWVLMRGVERRSEFEDADPELWYSPANAAEGLQEQLWNQCAGAVLCSATLAIGKRFDKTYQALGLGAETPCFIIDGGFDYANQGQIVMPDYAVEPTDSEAHDKAILTHLDTLWGRDLGALVLFSSRAQLSRIYEAIDQRVASQVLSQLAMGKGALIGHHQLRRDQRQTSVIFGLQSYSEGIDLPGHLLEEVVITRLPFLQPDDPIQATYAEWVEAQGQRAFSALTLPLASIRLRQAVGRLIRSEQDTGQVTLLDRRIKSKGYGRQLLDDLPGFRRVGFDS